MLPVIVLLAGAAMAASAAPQAPSEPEPQPTPMPAPDTKPVPLGSIEVVNDDADVVHTLNRHAPRICAGSGAVGRVGFQAATLWRRAALTQR